MDCRCGHPKLAHGFSQFACAVPGCKCLKFRSWEAKK